MYNQMIDSSAFCGANRHVVRGQPCRRVPLWRLAPGGGSAPDKHVILTSLTGGVRCVQRDQCGDCHSSDYEGTKGCRVR